MKTRLSMWFLLLPILWLAACNTDGEAYLAVAYQTEDGIEYIYMPDGSTRNGIYADEANNRIYCPDGANDIVYLPAETHWGKSHNSPNIELRVEAICSMGQEKFDEFLQLFQLVQEP